MSTWSTSSEMSDFCASLANLLTKENPKKYMVQNVVVLLFNAEFTQLQTMIIRLTLDLITALYHNISAFLNTFK